MRIQPMTRLLIGSTLALVLTGSATAAAETPKYDVAISYSVLRDLEIDETLPVGWAAAVARNLNEWFAVVGEVSGNYKSIDLQWADINLNVHGFMAGPRFAHRPNATVTLFGQVLVGAARARAGAFHVGVSTTALAMQPGGGIDIALSPNVGIRLQGDYRAIRDEGEMSSQVRFAAGFVFGFGTR